MGVSIDIHCEACGWSRDFRLGTGAGMTRLRNALELVPEEQRPRMPEPLPDAPLPAEDYELRLFRCPACGRLLERLHVELCFADGRRRIASWRCDGCGAALLPVSAPEEIPALPCPDCGARSLRIRDERFWD